MKIILAMDSFKHCLRSTEICRLLKNALQNAAPQLEVVPLPLADGGEGTVEAVTGALGGALETVRVSDPLGRPVAAPWGRLSPRQAVFEMAGASGIELLKHEELDPRRASSFGTGELLRELLRHGIRDFTVGIGGSATVDGGAGMLQALGVTFFDGDGVQLQVPLGGGDLRKITRIDRSGMLPELAECRFRIACDVTNPLLGPTGAATVFGPQKGATAAMVQELEAGLTAFRDAAGNDDATTPGDGAAGGMGFALRTFLHAQMVSGAELILDAVGFARHLNGCAWVITGEGASDFQTLHGKLPIRVARIARAHQVPVILLSGALGERADELAGEFDAVFALANRPGSLDEALAATPENLARMGRNIAMLLTR